MAATDPRLARAWEAFRGAWWDPSIRETVTLGRPGDALDEFAWALFAQGAVETLDLRRTRWLAVSAPERLLVLLLSAALARGRASARLEDLISDLRRVLAWNPPESWSEAGVNELPARLALHGPLLEGMLREAAGSCGDDPRSLVRGTLRGESLVLAFSRYRQSEDALSGNLRALLAQIPARGREIPEALRDAAPLLHEQQLEAVRKALRHRLVVIAGGPGTGKTTVVARILAALEAVDPDHSRDSTVLCAPTGRAKARLQESLARQDPSRPPPAASTLHALLGPRPDGTFRHDASRPLPWRTIVLDEASMVDQLLFAGLLEALPPQARLVVLGDPDQLPSVEAGGLFADLVAHLETLPEPTRPYARLTHTWRNDGAIRSLAEEVNQGRTDLAGSLAARPVGPEALSGSTVPGDVRWLTGDLEAVLARWWEVHAFRSRPEGDLSGRLGSSRILCASHHGPAGRERLNALGDAHLRSGSGSSPVADPSWPCDRPVLLTRNLAALDLWNGDLGLTSLREGLPAVRFPKGDGEVAHAPARLEGLEPAWAITIHKSQGSEFDHVLLVLPEEDSPLLTRQILYTGLTRARRTLWIWGKRSLWEAAVARRDDRTSALLDLRAPEALP